MLTQKDLNQVKDCFTIGVCCFIHFHFKIVDNIIKFTSLEKITLNFDNSSDEDLNENKDVVEIFELGDIDFVDLIKFILDNIEIFDNVDFLDRDADDDIYDICKIINNNYIESLKEYSIYEINSYPTYPDPRTEGLIELEYSKCEIGSCFWDGESKRCVCFNRRVYWEDSDDYGGYYYPDFD